MMEENKKKSKFQRLFNKFKLLLWKNSILFLSQFYEIILMLIFLAVITGLLLYFRVKYPIEVKSETYYKPFSIDTLEVFKNETSKMKKADPNYGLELKIAYSPYNELLDEVIKDAANKLEIKYKGFKNIGELKLDYLSKNFIAGIEFDDNLRNMKEYPENLMYTLHFPAVLRFCTHQTWKTSHISPQNVRGPRNPEDNDGGCSVGYLREGFLPLQHAISMSYIKKSANITDKELPKVEMQRFPYGSYMKDDLIADLKLWLSFGICICYIPTYFFLVMNIVHEREVQLSEILKINGVESYLQLAAWFVMYLLVLAIYAIFITMVVLINFHKNGGILNYTDFLVFYLYLFMYNIYVISFCFMITLFFHKAKFAAIFAAFICYMSSIPGIDELNINSPVAKLLISIIPNIALSYGFNIILNYEAEGEGVDWHNLFHPVNETEVVSLGILMVVMFVYSIFYMLLAWYVEVYMSGISELLNVIYSMVTLKYWKKKNQEEFQEPSANERHTIAFETIPTGRQRGVKVKNLWKKYDDDVIAIKGFTINLHKDEITVLLGHVGSGKTTLMRMLSGALSPTAGTAIIYGFDLCKDVDEVRRVVGFVPNKNILFEHMSVANHIRFYSRLRGLKKNEVNMQLKIYLKVLNLEKKPNIKPAKLTGDMKRKLVIICAMVGDTKVLICDEPAKGIKAESKRHVWDLLYKEKIGRTIFVTTNSKYEAEALGDRIGIMYNGELICYGTPFYLKKKLGPGYYLICKKKKDCDVVKVHMIVSQFVPAAIYQNYTKEIVFILPDVYAPKFGSLLLELEKNADYFRIEKCSMYVATMDEVFLHIGIMHYNAENASRHRLTELSSPCFGSCESLCKKEEITGGIYSDDAKPVHGFHWYIHYQWKAMFSKRFYQTYHNLYTVILLNLFAIFLLALPIFLMYVRNLSMKSPPFALDLQGYEKKVICLDSQNSNPEFLKINDNYKKFIESHDGVLTLNNIKGSDMEKYLLSFQQYFVTNNYLGGATFKGNAITVWFNNEFYHLAPLSLAILHDAILKSTSSPTKTIKVVSDPFPATKKMLLVEDAKLKKIFVTFSIILTFFASIVTYCCLAFIIKEKAQELQLLQFIAGAHVHVFWLAHLLWDMMLFLLTSLICCFAIKLSFPFSFPVAAFFALLLSFMLFGFALLSLIYFISLISSSVVNTFVFIVMLSIFSCIIYEITLYYGVNESLIYYFRIIPQLCFAECYHNIILNLLVRNACYGDILEELSVEARCTQLPECCIFTNFLAWSVPGTLKNLVILLVTGLVLFFCILIYTTGWPTYILLEVLKPIFSNEKLYGENTLVDSHVIHERRYIEQSSGSKLYKKSIIVHGITKFFGWKLALKRISFIVNRHESFGVVGASKSGKTTLCRIIVAACMPSFGNIIVRGINAITQKSKARKLMGYCPSAGGIFNDFTVYENFRIYFLLRGVKKKRTKFLIQELAKILAITNILYKFCYKLKDAERRKINVGIALIGFPKLLILDNPTSDCDPVTRKELWRVIRDFKHAGVAILLTTYSVWESRKLCKRTTILVDGRLKALGTIYHIRNRYSKMIYIIIKIRRDFGADISDTNGGQISYVNITETLIAHSDKIKRRLTREFPECVLDHESTGLLTFVLPVRSALLSSVFMFVEQHRYRLNIEDYIITQTMLDQILKDFVFKKTNEGSRMLLAYN